MALVDQCHNIDFILREFVDMIIEQLHIFAPIKMITKRDDEYPWITKSVKNIQIKCND